MLILKGYFIVSDYLLGELSVNGNEPMYKSYLFKTEMTAGWYHQRMS